MRSAILASVAAIGSALTLLHCASNDTAGPTESSDAAAEAAAAVDPADGGAADVQDAGPADAPVVVAHCSPDHWCRTPIGKDVHMLAVWSFGPNDVLALAQEGVYHWDGAAWSPVVVDAGGALDGLTGMWSNGPNDLWAVAQGKRKLTHGSRDGGAFSWSSTEMDGGQTLDAITGNGSELFVEGILEDGTPALEHGTIGDGGAAPVFEPIPITVPNYYYSAMYASGAGELWLAGVVDGFGAILRAEKQGATWDFTTSFTMQGRPITDFFGSMWGDGPNDIWATGARDANLHRTTFADGGVDWEPQPNHSATTAIANIWGSGPNDVYTVGYFGGVRHWDGVSWKVSQIAVNGNPIYSHLFGVHGSSAADVWAVGDGVALHRTPTGGP